MDVRLWGPACWETMHAITYVYPEHLPTRDDRESMIRFFYAMGDVLPCFKCRYHFKKMLQNNPIQDNLNSREALTHWLIDRHNEVNERLGKPVVSYEFVDSKYSDYSNQCPVKDLSTDKSDPKKHQQSKVRKRVEVALVIFAMILFVAIILMSCKLVGSN